MRTSYDLKKKNWFNIGGKSKLFYLADNLKEWYDTDVKERRKVGLKAREFATDDEIGMTAKLMGRNMSEAIDTCFEKFTPRKRFTIIEA